MIEFIEDQNEGYAPRTITNASADVTIAFARDFNTHGEKLTKKAVKDQRKLYIPVKDIFLKDQTLIHDLVLKVSTKIDEEYNTTNFPNNACPQLSINIAGNGIYTMRGLLTQQQIDDFVFEFMRVLQYDLEHLLMNIKLVRSGGQTGFDEAGLKAADKLGLKTLCLAPKGWKFRNLFGQDISNEIKFKERFITNE